MTTIASEVAKAEAPVSYFANDLISSRGYVALGTVALAAGDMLDIVRLPGGHQLVSMSVDADVLDSNGAPAASFDIGFISGLPGDIVNARAIGNEFGSGLTTFGRTAAVELSITVPRVKRVPPQPVDRSIGIKVNAGPATAVVQAGSLTTNRGGWQSGMQVNVGDYLVLPGGAIVRCTTAGTAGANKDASGNVFLDQANWVLGFGLTTQDGSAVWTCVTPIVGITVNYRPSKNNY